MILLVFIVICVINLIQSISGYIDTKKQIDIKVATHGQKPYVTLEQKSTTTLAIVNTIDRLVTMEIEDTLKTYARLNQKYNAVKMAEDIEAISGRVYNAIKKSVYESDDILITDEYLMNYIATHTTITFIRIVKGLNDVIREA
jgi:hypothetical protein